MHIPLKSLHHQQSPFEFVSPIIISCVSRCCYLVIKMGDICLVFTRKMEEKKKYLLTESEFSTQNILS